MLTVVIPSFNVEKYLRQTLESLRNEEILEDVEVLIVDDQFNRRHSKD
ncbi:MAG: glycosyltransferase [Blautia obeum]